MDDNREAIEEADTARGNQPPEPEEPDYGRMSFKDFSENVWLPRREREVSPETYAGEKRHLDGRDVSPRTLTMDRHIYRSVMKRAYKLGAIKAIPHLDSIPGATKRTLVVTAFTAEEVPKVLDATDNGMHRVLFALGVGDGLRPAELVSVRWEDNKWERRQIYLSGGTKTARSASTIPLTDLSYREMERW